MKSASVERAEWRSSSNIGTGLELDPPIGKIVAHPKDPKPRRET